MRRETRKLLASYLDSLCPVIYIHHSDFHEVDEVLNRTKEPYMQLCEYTNADRRYNSLADFIISVMDDAVNLDDDEHHELVMILKDVHDSINDPKVIALIRKISENTMTLPDYHAKIIIIDTRIEIPLELESFIKLIDVPLPDDEEIKECVNDFSRDVNIKLTPDAIEDIIFSLKGLSAFQIQQILSVAYQSGGKIDETSRKFILEEKEQMIKKSGILEMINFDEKISDIGGLENLKEWLKRKAAIFSQLERARKNKIDIPNGVLILGMPGCGKSLTAKAASSMFKVPLIRLDVGRLMGRYVGESEDNLRRALRLSEAVSPCVLWVDELEKAFAGIGSDTSGITTRLFGQFLTWMQEKRSSVFIIATANDISKLPPEFLRKGRFDELFFVDLPNESERKKILEIHLMKRDKMNGNIDLEKLSRETNGFNGSDLEGIIKEAAEKAFLDGKKTITTELLMSVRRDSKSISDIQTDKIKALRESLKKYDIKPASA